MEGASTGALFIDGQWVRATGEEFVSLNPATEEVIWEGQGATQGEIALCIAGAQRAFAPWSALTVQQRFAYVQAFEKKVQATRAALAQTLCQEIGKPLWEAHQEIDCLCAQIDTALQAYQERSVQKIWKQEHYQVQSSPKAQGLLLVFAPFGRPAALPYSHVIPALLAGNTVILKGHEMAPKVAQTLMELWNLPPGVLNLLQGPADVGQLLVEDPAIAGVLFTGGTKTGGALAHTFQHTPEKLLVLDMGGNNPLIFRDCEDVERAAYLTVLSAFLTSGQQCTCARRLIVVDGPAGEEFLKTLIPLAKTLNVGPYTANPEPFMGPVISLNCMERMLAAQGTLGSMGGKCLVEMRPLEGKGYFLTPGIMDVTGVQDRPDEEFFGPFLQVVRVPTWEEALVEANQTRFGLCASLIAQDPLAFQEFFQRVRAGVLNWNTPTTEISPQVPYGGVGRSGNHHPGGYWATDYCSYPVASTLSPRIYIPQQHPGLGYGLGREAIGHGGGDGAHKLNALSAHRAGPLCDRDNPPP